MSPAKRYADPADADSPVGTLSLNGAVIPAHNPADVAAELVLREWTRSAHSSAWWARLNAIQRAVQQAGVSGSAWWEIGMVDGGDMVEHGARLGYAMALTAHHQRDGWEAWLRAAHAELARSGCSAADHLALDIAHFERATEAIRKEAVLTDEPPAAGAEGQP